MLIWANLISRSGVGVYRDSLTYLRPVRRGAHRRVVPLVNRASPTDGSKRTTRLFVKSSPVGACLTELLLPSL